MRKVTPGRAAASVLLVGLDNDALGMVKETLAAEAVLPNNSISYGEAPDQVRRNKPDVVIIGFSSKKDDALNLAQVLIKEGTKSTLIALSKESDAQSVLSAMRTGFKEFVVLPGDATRLRQVCHQAAFSPDDDEDKGTVIALIGAKGGVGVTTIITQLAAELAGIHRVLAIDLDLGMGDLSSMFDVNPKDTIADLLTRADRIDERVLAASVDVHRTKVHILATPADVDNIGEVNPDDLYAIINASAKAYQFVLIDCGTYINTAVQMAVQAADVVVVVTNPEVVAIRDAFRRLKMLERNQVDKERIKLVVNRWRKGAYVTLEVIGQNLNTTVAAVVADDPVTIGDAVNKGKLAREINKKADVVRDISNLVAVLTEDGGAPPPSDDQGGSVGGFFSNLFGRG